MFKQFQAVSLMSLLTLPQRIGASSVIVIGIAGVVAVLISVLAMGVGFRHTLADSGRADRATCSFSYGNSQRYRRLVGWQFALLIRARRHEDGCKPDRPVKPLIPVCFDLRRACTCHLRECYFGDPPAEPLPSK